MFGSREIRHVKKKSRKRFYFLVLVICLILFAFKIQGSKQDIKSLNLVPTPTNIPTPTKPSEDTALSNVVKNSIVNTDAKFGVAIVNLKTNQSYFQNEYIQFDAASLYKLWVMAAVYQKIETKQWKLTDIFSESIPRLNELFQIDEKNAEQKTGEIKESVQEALNKMIIISDNYSGLLLAEKIGLDSLQRFLNQYGLANSKVGARGSSPTTSAYDTFLFYSYLYNNQFLGSKEMIALLKKQALNEKIPKNLPPLISVAHKTGELDGYSHDAGIVYGNKSDYIIVVLSKSDNLSDTNEAISNLSKNVYDYFSEP